MGDPCCCFATSSGTVKIIERFGAFQAIARPGCNVKMPCIDCVSGVISMRLQQMEISCDTKTKDNVRLLHRRPLLLAGKPPQLTAAAGSLAGLLHHPRGDPVPSDWRGQGHQRCALPPHQPAHAD